MSTPRCACGEKIAALEGALRLVPLNEWQALAEDDLLDLIDATVMLDFVEAVRDVLGGNTPEVTRRGERYRRALEEIVSPHLGVDNLTTAREIAAAALEGK